MRGRRRRIGRRRFRRGAVFCKRWRRRRRNLRNELRSRRRILLPRRGLLGGGQFRPTFVAILRAIEVIGATVIASDHSCNGLRLSENSEVVEFRVPKKGPGNVFTKGPAYLNRSRSAHPHSLRWRRLNTIFWKRLADARP